MTRDQAAWEELHQKYKTFIKDASVEEIADLLKYRKLSTINVFRNARILQQHHQGVPPKDTMAAVNVSKARYHELCKATYRKGIANFIDRQPKEFIERLRGNVTEEGNIQ